MTTSIRRTLASVLIAALVSMGCASTYTPQEPGRIHFLAAGKGQLVLEKDGKTYESKWYSADLVDLVSGHPAAEEHARTFVRRQRIGGALTIVGVAGLLVGYVLMATAITSDPRSIDRRQTAIVGVSTLLASCASLIGGLALGASGQGHLYDAVNIHNDDVLEGRRRLREGAMGLPRPLPFGRLVRPRLIAESLPGDSRE
jgi:hypothetical protein